MRSRPVIWLLVSVMLFVAGACFWRAGDKWVAERTAAPPPRFPAPSAVPHGSRIARVPSLSLLSPSNFPSPTQPVTQHAIRNKNPLALRVSNTPTPLGQLVRCPTALLLENALLDTDQPLALAIPDHLRAQGDPGAYVVQSRAPLDDSFRARLQAAGAVIVAYIPNQAYLVRASPAVAQQLQADPGTQTVLPYEPYFKLKPPLLGLAVEQQPLPDNSALNVLLFPDARAAALAELNNLGVQVLGEERSPFGPVLRVQTGIASAAAGQTSPVASAGLLPALAQLGGVQEIEVSRTRMLANDLSRARIGVAADTTTTNNYLGLTGSNVLVNVNDSGVDTNQPDLRGRVKFDVPISGVDTNGHGTHVAGIIAGSGLESLTVTNASGSIMPAVSNQFRGLAPAAQVFAIAANPDPGPVSDTYLQETAARTNTLISNNSWHYANDNDYDLAAARYDAAVRDALPEVSGSQPLLFVFGAGNAGNAADDGSGGAPDSVQSPATAKNVITVGAIDQPRQIANQVWQCAMVNGTNVCQTNQPWLGLTATNNVVASFSSRGNVGVGIEGSFGRFKPDVVAPGTFVVSTRSTEWDQVAYCSATNVSGNYFQVLSNLNNGLGPFYHYESGTSLAAAEVSGALALMQEFFQRSGRTNSPALMKALLINGARPLTAPGACQVNNSTNSQGWGLINLTNSLPIGLSNSFVQAAAPMQVFDQSPADALATGQSHTRFVSLSSAATNLPLRITLVWTDPPANPAAGLKLVNNLNLVITNLSSGKVFFGNDLSLASGFTQSWDTNTPPNLDVVNNVENVALPPAFAANYSVTVVARNVNVNAVTGWTNSVVQDYALVISSGEGLVTNALTVTDTPVASGSSANVTFITNSFAPGQGISGALLLNQRVGAQGPVPGANSIPWPGGPNGVITVGITNQWHFYVLTNDQNYNYAAFLTFNPVNLSLPRLGVNQTNLDNATRTEADIDLYVSTDPGLISLDTNALAAADTVLGRGGTGAVVYNSVAPGAVYYVGVKAEDQEAAQYAFMGVFSRLPFSQQDVETGIWTLRGINLPALIPDATTAQPGVTNVLAIAPASIPIRRVVVTNELWHESFSDLSGTLSHGGKSVVLNNHSLPPVTPAPYRYTYVYEDNGEGDIPRAQATDGPGSLRDFIGQEGMGVWVLTMTDTVSSHTGLVENLTIRLDPQTAGTGISLDVLTNASYLDFVDVPIGGTNLTVCLYNDSYPPLPVALYVRRGNAPTQTSFDQMLAVNGLSGCLSLNLSNTPSFSPGRYYIAIFNSNGIPQAITLDMTVDFDPNGPVPVTYTAAGPTPILDDAASFSTIQVTNASPVLSVNVGVRIDHPRVSDLVLTLVSPSGTRVLLDENRGGTSTNGMGLNILLTNSVYASSSGGPPASTNIINTPSTSGSLTIAYSFYSEADTLHVYSGTNLTPANLIFDSGAVLNSGIFYVAFSTNYSRLITIFIDEGRPITAWNYTATLISPALLYATFTEDPTLTATPIKFALPPFSNVTLDPNTLAPSTGIYYLPEESLDALVGEPALGAWTLEILDNRAGAANPPPSLVSWQLSFLFPEGMPLPIPLNPAVAQTNTIAPGPLQYFSVNVPLWARFATNQLLAATAPLNLLFNQDLLPTGANTAPPDFSLLSAATTGSSTLSAAGGSPTLVPGQPYFLGVQNTNATTVTFTLAINFDLTLLTSGVPVFAANSGAGNGTDYYHYIVTTNALRAQFEIDSPSGDVTLVARDGPPPPTVTSFDYLSANPGINDELITLFNFSRPVALTPGDWYISVVNVSGGPVSYTIKATEFSAYATNVVITSCQALTNSLCLTWTSVSSIHYYVQGKTSVTDTNWVAVSPTIVAADVQTSYCVALPSPYQFFRVSEGLAVTTYVPPVQITSIARDTNGVRLQWLAPTNSQFQVQWTTYLAPSAWTPFTTIHTSTDGAFSFLDDGYQSGGLAGPRYYRLRQLP